MIVHYLTNFIVGILFRNIYKSSDNKVIEKERITLPFMDCLIKSITNSINVIFLVYGIIIFTSLLTNIIYHQYIKAY